MSRDRLLTLVVVVVFAFGALTQALGLEPVLGGFVAGILFGQMRRLPDAVHKQLESIALGVFAPIFFASAGLKVNIQALLDPTLGAIALLVIFVASFGKVAGTYTGARLVGGRDHWTALSYGAGLNARGALEIIIATVGLQVGILSQEMFSVIVVMAMATSIMAPFALRATLKRVTPEQQEVERLRREELAEGSLVDQVDRVLLPVRYRESTTGTAQAIEARLLERLAARRDLSITLLTVVPEGARSQARAFLEELKASLFAEAETALKVVEGKRVADAILNEAEKDYDLIILGAPEFPGRSEVVFNPLVDYVVRMAPCTTMVVRGGSVPEDWKMRRLLVPTNGSVAARRAAEMAFALIAPDRPDDEAGENGGETGAAAGEAGADVTILNVMVEGEDPHHVDAGGKLIERRMAIAREMVEEIRELGQGMGLSPTAEVRRGRDPETVIMDVAREMGKDLLVIGTDIRPGSDRLFLGPRVENLLLRASCPVVVVNTAR